jgi:hypothetical protein
MDSYPNAAPEAEYSRDLALLEHLKETIRAGQHPYYRPIPRPDKLMNMYLGPHRAAGSFVLPHPEQLPGHDSAVQSHALGSSSRPVVVDSDSSRQSSVERSAGPTRSAVEVDQVRLYPSVLRFAVLTLIYRTLKCTDKFLLLLLVLPLAHSSFRPHRQFQRPTLYQIPILLQKRPIERLHLLSRRSSLLLPLASPVPTCLRSRLSPLLPCHRLRPRVRLLRRSLTSRTVLVNS